MSQDFKPLFEYLDNMKEELKHEITTEITGSLGSKIDKLQNSVDSFAKSNIKFDQELTVQTHRINNIETWVKPTAKKLDVPYTA